MPTRLRKSDNTYLDADDITGMVAAGGVDPLTENATDIGGTNDGDIPTLTATAAALTGTLTGTANGSLADVAAIALSTSDTYTDSAVNTAVNAAITAVNEQLKELQAMVNKLVADDVVLRAGVRENAAKTNELITALEG